MNDFVKKFKNKAREQRITFLSGNLRLRGKILFPDTASPEHPVPGAVLCHGFGSSHRQIAPSARMLAERGIATIIFDLRGHCTSDGALDGDVINDVVSAWSTLKKNPEVDSSRIGLVGHSLGAMAAIMAADTVRPSALVALSCPPQMEEMFADYPEDFGHWGAKHNRVMEYPRQGSFPWLKGLSALGCRAWMYLFGYTVRVNMKKFAEAAFKWNMFDALAKMESCPKLFIFCEGDSVTPYARSASVYEAAPEPKEKVLSKGGMHTTPIMGGSLRNQWVEWLSGELSR
jgi:pimeloyl-ACP methyl ester carboxylesterase